PAGSTRAKKGGAEPARPLIPAPASASAAAATQPRRATTHLFPTPLVELSLDLVREAGVSLRGTPRVLDVVSRALKLGWDIPHWTTVRNWLLRAGLARWQLGLQRAGDWLLLIDHSVKIGTEKGLLVLG